jgi:hypothetical protein
MINTIVNNMVGNNFNKNSKDCSILKKNLKIFILFLRDIQYTVIFKCQNIMIFISFKTKKINKMLKFIYFKFSLNIPAYKIQNFQVRWN